MATKATRLLTTGLDDRTEEAPPRIVPFPKQRDFIYDLSDICGAITGIGGAKTYSGAVKVVLCADGQPGIRILVTAPTFTQLEQATFRQIRSLLHPSRVASFNKNEHVLTLVNGSEIHYQSADNPDHFRGPEYGMVWMDEAAYCTEQAYLIMMGRLRQGGVHRQAVITSTPAGYNWMHEYLIAKPISGTTVHTWTSFDNIYLPKTYLDMLSQTYEGTDFYAQELMGDFVAFRGLVYMVPRDVWVDINHDPKSNPFVRVFGGIDFGSTNPYAHASAAYVIGEDHAGRFWVVEEFHRYRASAEEFGNWLAEMQERWKVERWEADKSQAVGIELMNLAGLHIVQTPPPTEVTVLDGIQIVQRRLSTGGLFINRAKCPQLAADFGRYQWREPKDGIEQKREPLKIKDDSMDAMRYGVAALERAANSARSQKRQLVAAGGGGNAVVYRDGWQMRARRGRW